MGRKGDDGKQVVHGICPQPPARSVTQVTRTTIPHHHGEGIGEDVAGLRPAREAGDVGDDPQRQPVDAAVDDRTSPRPSTACAKPAGRPDEEEVVDLVEVPLVEAGTGTAGAGSRPDAWAAPGSRCRTRTPRRSRGSWRRTGSTSPRSARRGASSSTVLPGAAWIAPSPGRAGKDVMGVAAVFRGLGALGPIRRHAPPRPRRARRRTAPRRRYGRRRNCTTPHRRKDRPHGQHAQRCQHRPGGFHARARGCACFRAPRRRR